jgi:uncharacterized membrane protein YfcA
MEFVKYVLIGLAIGSISGVMGIGGGVLLVPVLVWLCDFKLKEATGTSLAILIPPIGLPAALKAYQNDEVNLPAALCIAAAFTVGAFTSRTLVEYVPENWLRMGFGFLMMYIAFRFIISSSSDAANAAAGLAAMFVAGIAFLGLRALGRRHLPAPELGKHIQAKSEQGWGESDYHI